jgi:hypothetical protein
VKLKLKLKSKKVLKLQFLIGKRILLPCPVALGDSPPLIQGKISLGQNRSYVPEVIPHRGEYLENAYSS